MRYNTVNTLTQFKDGGYSTPEEAADSSKMLQKRYPLLGPWEVEEIEDGHYSVCREYELHSNHPILLEGINDLMAWCPINRKAPHTSGT